MQSVLRYWGSTYKFGGPRSAHDTFSVKEVKGLCRETMDPIPKRVASFPMGKVVGRRRPAQRPLGEPYKMSNPETHTPTHILRTPKSGCVLRSLPSQQELSTSAHPLLSVSQSISFPNQFFAYPSHRMKSANIRILFQVYSQSAAKSCRLRYLL